MSVRLIPILGIPEVAEGDDIAALIVSAVRSAGLTLEGGDVVVVTQKAVSKAEGRVVPERPLGKAGWVERETRRVVARRGDLVIAETRHGFVCANAGVDASNVPEGFLALLPEDPDASAERIRAGLEAATGAPLAVVVTDTFGRPWRSGVINVAIGCAGLPSLVDLRGTKDAHGRVLDATIVALADEVAAAGGLVMGKAAGTPAAVVRGLHLEGPHAPAADLVRSPDDDLFREGTSKEERG
jgi:coenzyme F420-0:L-glutamate ligase/coenzyme F420-1:gamma-L-glutamate ligase